MAGVYIDGMNIPKAAGKYRIEFDSCGNPYLLSDNGDLGLWHIIPIPNHGRLGDLDELSKSFDTVLSRYDAGLIDKLTCINMLLQTFNNSTTIIPRDKEES